MSDIKKGDLVIVIRNTAGPNKYDSYIGRIFTIHEIYSSNEYIIEKGLTIFDDVIAAREELKKIEPLDDDEIIEERELEHVD